MRLRRRRWLAAILPTIAIVLAAFLWLTRPPGWYAPPDPKDRDVADLAERVESNFVQQAHKARQPEETWTRRVHDSQVNAWLSARLREWVINQEGRWPSRLGTPQVLFEPDGISIAAPIGGDAEPVSSDRQDDGQGRRSIGTPLVSGRMLVARLAPEITEGGLRLRLDRVAIGRLSLPGEPVQALARRLQGVLPDVMDGAEAAHLLDVLAGRESLPAELELGDGRRVELVGLKLGQGWIEFTARTRPAKRKDIDDR